MKNIQYRIGIGYDIHRLVSGRKLVLGGVFIPFFKGLFAHSDGDVLLHAICDALLGAAGLGDIGVHFPDSDKKYKGISSLELLARSANKIAVRGFRVENVDTVLIADNPKISPYRARIINKISSVLKIPKGSINLKATTNEGVGPIGKKAIASYAVALLRKAVRG